jgi:hypothetical protein
MKKLSVLVALLACSWVLWDATFKTDDLKWSYSVSDAYESKLECEVHGDRGLAIAVSSGVFKATEGRGVWDEKRGIVFSFKCLPDTVRP